ncbi:hypothetical protein [Imtechella halotolerans]|uniref:Uncharacterized protein n=1 Tax=Imtechella halotolerans K1 TaxID=946077 RepID=I0W8J0_9FLAO|nr:hypothetical protein [Imtechella halotolerans]EID72706.1 hypothetical protein W5A_11274 [Imtechella halotolerans K1]WMQ64628.1 hypothetical protein PT603_06490 [Imtechella halotolerans]
MKNYSILILSIVFLFGSCKDIQEKAIEKTGNTVIEKTMKHIGGATDNIERVNKNDAQVSIEYDGKKLFVGDQFNTIVNVSKQMILFSIDSQKDDAKINITFSGLKDMLESKPIIGIHEIGKSNPKELNGTTINILLAKENDFAYTLFQGEGSIISFSQETVLIKFSGKAGSFTQANQPENWRNISGEIKIKYPITNLIQVDKKHLYY